MSIADELCCIINGSLDGAVCLRQHGRLLDLDIFPSQDILDLVFHLLGLSLTLAHFYLL